MPTNATDCATHNTVNSSWEKVNTLYTRRNLISNISVLTPDTDIKALMKTRAGYGDMLSSLETHINHYGSKQVFSHEVRCNEIGETAHCIMSHLCYVLNNEYGAVPALRATKGTEVIKPQLRLVQANAIASCEGGDYTSDDLTNITLADMKQYNRGALTDIVRKDVRTNMVNKVKDYLTSNNSEHWEDFYQALKAQTHAIQEVLKDDFYGTNKSTANDIYHKKSRGIILWNKNNKVGDPDDGRLALALKAIKASGASAIVLMGDQFSPNRTHYNENETCIKTNSQGVVSITIKGETMTVVDYTRRANITDFEKNNLLAQWYAMKYVSDNCSLRAMVCAARTGGCHGLYLIGTPLVYIDNNLGSANSFMQERMSLQGLLDDYITAVPNLKGTGTSNIKACKDWVSLVVSNNLKRFFPGDENFRERPNDIAL